MNDLKTELIKAREEYIDIIRSEMLGPGSEFSFPDAEHELISSSPVSRYSVGILYPQGNKVDLENDDTSKTSEIENSKAEEDEDNSESKQIKVEGVKSVLQTEDFDDDNLDEEVSMSAQYMPSSMGMTFIVDNDVTEVKGHVNFGTYRDVKLANECVVPFSPENPETFSLPAELAKKVVFDKEAQTLTLQVPIKRKDVKEIIDQKIIPEPLLPSLQARLYRLAEYYAEGKIRVPHDFDFVVNFSTSNYSSEKRNENIDETTLKVTALKTPMSDNRFSITIMLTNDSEGIPKSDNCIFQPKITINSEENGFCFKEIGYQNNTGIMDAEEQSLELLYRHKKNYGTGLGTSVDWNIDELGHGYLWTDFIPMKEVPPMDFGLPEGAQMSSSDLSMKYFSDLSPASKEEKLLTLKKLVNLYDTWIQNLEETAKKLDPYYKTAATKNIENCKFACKRMYAGIETLSVNENAYNAFGLANRAMFMQRVHLKMQDNNKAEDCLPNNQKITEQLKAIDYHSEKDDETVKCWWRPFQIAFILLDINSIVNDKSDDRRIVDLIWFPTGGGKTEAYLGLTAFTIFYQKLSHLESSNGTTVIMRYTLRLLTAQQFTRASTLICACEFIREDCSKKSSKYPTYDLGKEPITIGLWIGGSHVPNKNDEAKKCLDKLIKASTPYELANAKENNKFQVLKCPWCGTKLTREIVDKKIVGEWGYTMRMGKHFKMNCTNESCPFRASLPIQIIDEELYNNPPTLLFGTVDKFAMITWVSEAGQFFSSTTMGKPNRPPELIIQDELHLISGSLGTMVGLYESVIDALCSQRGIEPKIVASTATIRKANEQCSNLYNRTVAQFPSPGLDADDSFFAKEKRIDYASGSFGRKYIGIMPSGKTKAMTEIRLMAALLQRLYSHDFGGGDNENKIKDAFWTITAYYNSLRDLGKASTLISDDVKDFIIRIANKLFEKRRSIIKVNELTSRVTTTELNTSLDVLEKNCYLGEDGYENSSQYPTSVVLATNMISVGIDISRLNIMLMLGQPKLTSEYIQASSRVGRTLPGAIFVQYDATKSRDRSHYESFKSYHESFYRFVEPTGVTPFSRPARDRALHSALTALIRQTTKELSGEKDAGKFDKTKYADIINDVETFFVERIQSINARDTSGAYIDIDEVKKEMDYFFDEWENAAKTHSDSPLYYGKTDMMNDKANDGRRRLLMTYEARGKDGVRRTLTSMRSVDGSVLGKIIIKDGGEK